MRGRRHLPLLALALGALAAVCPAQQPRTRQQAAPAEPAKPAQIVEMQAYRRSGVVSAWLANGLRVHHRSMKISPGQVEIMISFAGGELLECTQTRGLSLLSAAFLDHPAAESIPSEESDRRLQGRDIHIEGGVLSDALLIRIWGSAADIPEGLKLVAASLTAPDITPDRLETARTTACDTVKKAERDARWGVTEPLLDLVTPVGECRTKLACTNKLSGYTTDQVKDWIGRHTRTSPCEIAIVGDIPTNEALRLIADTFGELPERIRATPQALAAQRCVAVQPGPFVRDVGCKPEAGLEQAHVLAGFLSPDPSEIQEIRRLRAGARVLSGRLEDRLRELKLGGDPHVSWTYMPSPFAGRSVTVVAARVTPGDAEPVKQVMQASMCELMDHGLPADELARTTEALARVAAAYERDPRYWAAILARSASGGLDPEQIADGPEVYRAMKPDEVLAAMRRACTIENRLDLVVRPAP